MDDGSWKDAPLIVFDRSDEGSSQSLRGSNPGQQERAS
jgi:hypothetical protein